LRRAKAALASCLEQPQTGALLDLLQDAQSADAAELPETGVGPALEKMLSSVFIATPSYGTCASTALIVEAVGIAQLAERRFGPGGVLQGETRLDIRQLPAPKV
jgi:uncharacterized protein with NRDE domain